MKLYLYCLSDDLEVGQIEAVAGIAGAVTRAIDLGAVRAVVSDVHIHEVKVSKENVLAHERVIDRVMAQTTPLPFRFGVVVNPAELQSYVESNEDRLRALLESVRGAVEMNVKIIWDREAIRNHPAEKHSRDHAGKAEGAGPGLRFLLAKQQEMAVEREVKGRAEEIAAWLDRGVDNLVRDKVVTLNPDEALVIRAAYLVERGRVAEYREQVNSLGRERNELRFLTSGAWPPYSFTHLRS
jgi:hypothetical protein